MVCKFWRWLVAHVWRLIPEPRAVTAVMLVAWGVVIGVGTLVLLDPPRSISGEVGSVLSLVWGIVLTVGGALGALGCAIRFWWLERAGAFLTIAGLLIYLSTIVHLHVVEEGNRLVQAFTVFGFMLLFLTRLLRIWGLHADPRPRR